MANVQATTTELFQEFVMWERANTYVMWERRKGEVRENSTNGGKRLATENARSMAD
jgi:hypothetical protein